MFPASRNSRRPASEKIRAVLSTLVRQFRCRLGGISPAQDLRGYRLVFAIECIANQNARDGGAAQSPCAQIETLEILLEHDVGIAQIPCPEMACLGLARARPAGTSIRAALLRPEAQASCRHLVQQTIERLQDYRDHGVQVLAILGGNAASPACAVHGSGDPLWPAALSKDSGIFMQALAGAIAERAIDVPFRGIRDAEAGALADDLSWLRARVSR